MFTADDKQYVFVAVLKFLAWNLYIRPKVNQEKCLGHQAHSANNC
jgi:hypothetical protein